MKELYKYDEKIVIMILIPIVLILNFVWNNFGFWFVIVWIGINLAYLKD